MLVYLVSSIFRVMELAIVLECILSWVIQDRSNGIMAILQSFTEPILRPFRYLQGRLLGNVPIDISPIFAIVALNILKPIVINIVASGLF
ncbi:MAG: YggT family protein [Clostridium sp.]|uniref:YggT family protein n=1 Tax=Clostridium sp. TaxID=1506 RepID=UPI003F2F0CAB